MSVKNVKRNEKNINENIVKLKFERNIKTLLGNHLIYICAEEIDFWQFLTIFDDRPVG